MTKVIKCEIESNMVKFSARDRERRFGPSGPSVHFHPHSHPFSPFRRWTRSPLGFPSLNYGMLRRPIYLVFFSIISP